MKPHFLAQLFLFLGPHLSGTNALAQQPFQLSSKFYEAQFSGLNLWNGEHRFNKVFCLTFPNAGDAASFAEALYNNDRLYFSRAAYNNLTALYVVSSTVPAGRSAEDEIANLEASHETLVATYPKNVSRSAESGSLGRSLRLVVRNATEGNSQSPFPFVRPTSNPPDGGLASASVHRLFVRNGNRIEVAGLRYFRELLHAEREVEAVAELSAIVEQAAQSLQACTANMPR
jgi:hypothetical protein